MTRMATGRLHMFHAGSVLLLRMWVLHLTYVVGSKGKIQSYKIPLKVKLACWQTARFHKHLRADCLLSL